MRKENADALCAAIALVAIFAASGMTAAALVSVGLGYTANWFGSGTAFLGAYLAIALPVWFIIQATKNDGEQS